MIVPGSDKGAIGQNDPPPWWEIFDQLTSVGECVNRFIKAGIFQNLTCSSVTNDQSVELKQLWFIVKEFQRGPSLPMISINGWNLGQWVDRVYRSVVKVQRCFGCKKVMFGQQIVMYKFLEIIG